MVFGQCVEWRGTKESDFSHTKAALEPDELDPPQIRSRHQTKWRMPATPLKLYNPMVFCFWTKPIMTISQFIKWKSLRDMNIIHLFISDTGRWT